MAQFSVDDATANLSRLIVEALAGGEVIITRGNVPVVRLVPTTPCGSGALVRSKEAFRSTHGLMSRSPTMSSKGGILLRSAA
jgi:prevent-host-death family protein